MKDSAACLKRASGLVLFVYLTMFALPVMSQTPDGLTPSEETVCDGLDGDLFGTCNAYCEAMDCDDPNHKASNKACQKKVQHWGRIAGHVPLPCNEGSAILMTKSVNDSTDPELEIPVGASVIYTFTITNSGNFSVVILALLDEQIAGALDDCTNALIGQTLAISESISCDSDADEIQAILQTVENTATVSAASSYGTPLSAQSTAIYTGSIVLDETLMGIPQAINFTPQLLVDQLLVEVADAWLTDPTISLDIEITGINGTFERHGEDVIDVVDTNVFSTDGTIAQTVVDWTKDTTTQNVNEVYTVCVQPIRNTTELIGPIKCEQFGPF